MSEAAAGLRVQDTFYCPESRPLLSSALVQKVEQLQQLVGLTQMSHDIKYEVALHSNLTAQ